jgi:hypothetical protein
VIHLRICSRCLLSVFLAGLLFSIPLLAASASDVAAGTLAEVL